jgi:hypothetical protein
MVHARLVPTKAAPYSPSNERTASVEFSDAEIDANNVARWASLRWKAAGYDMSDTLPIKFVKV